MIELGSIKRRRHLDADRATERDEPHLDVRRDLIDEVTRRLLGGLQPVRLDVGGHHRQGDVEQHEDAALALGPFGRRLDRAGDGDDTGGKPGELQGGDDVAPPSRPGRCDAIEQIDLREADPCLVPPPQHEHVGDGEGGNGQQPPQAPRVEEAVAGHWRPGLRKPSPVMAPQHLGVDRLHALASHVLDNRRQPIGVGSELDEVGAGSTDAVSTCLDLLRGRFGETPLDRRRHPHLAPPARRRIDDLDQTDRGHVELARVVHGDRQQVVAQAQPGEGIDPRVAGEVRDHGTNPRRRQTTATRSMAATRSAGPSPSAGGGDATAVSTART